MRDGARRNRTNFPAKEDSVKPRVIAFALILAGAIHFSASISETRAPTSANSVAQKQVAAFATTAPLAPPSGRLPTVAPDRLMPAFVAITPFAVNEIASLPREIASLPRREPPEPTATPAPPAPSPTLERTGCDPAYPDQSTCIPPGPPFGQGCAITDERRFTVLPPDPQRLDHDKDGIGCEPLR
jgi:hypothetical protein